MCDCSADKRNNNDKRNTCGFNDKRNSILEKFDDKHDNNDKRDVTYFLTTNVVMKLDILLDKRNSRKLTTNVTAKNSHFDDKRNKSYFGTFVSLFEKVTSDTDFE